MEKKAWSRMRVNNSESTAPPKQLTLFGSTGSVGRSTLEVVTAFPERFQVLGLAAHSNVALLREQIARFKPQYVAVQDRDAASRLRSLRLDVTILEGETGLCELAQIPVDVTLCAIVGAAGLQPLLTAIEAGNTVAVANKEPFVMAGKLVMEAAARNQVSVLPVDSEHNAIFQCLQGHDKADLHRIHLTASGGPFYGWEREKLRNIAPEEAVKHPTWDMGPKISVDSATLMNKGLEVIEAMWMFDLPVEQIDVVIHPQSIIHGLVEFTDGTLLAHMGVTDMKSPIQYALEYPERGPRAMHRLDLWKLDALTFAKPDFSEFPCLELARQAALEGGVAPAILNAANEVAVAAYCNHQISFLKISEVVAQVRASCTVSHNPNLETILQADKTARSAALQVIHEMEPLVS